MAPEVVRRSFHILVYQYPKVSRAMFYGTTEPSKPTVKNSDKLSAIPGLEDIESHIAPEKSLTPLGFRYFPRL